jgi:hypothetical protein
MKAIITKFMPATDTRGSRIKAQAEGVKSLSIPYPHEMNSEEGHRHAASLLCERMNWQWEFASGGLPDQTGYAHCFIK